MTTSDDSRLVFVAGATGATGSLLTRQFLEHGYRVRTVVRSPERLPADVRDHERLEITRGALLDLSSPQLAEQVSGCHAIASCLGHNLTWKGIFGPPRRLVTDATRRLCEAVRATRPERPVRFVLMNTAGNRNRDLDEPVSFAHRLVVGLIRLLVPPHADNEQASDHLRATVGQNDPTIEWSVLRPDSLTNRDDVSPYDLHASPTRCAIFNPGKTSRINVAHCMAALIDDDSLWSTWRGRMPVIYDTTT